MIKKPLIISIFLILFAFLFFEDISVAGEKVENVRVKQVGEDVHIYYDLLGDEDKYQVKVRGSSDGGRTYTLPMKSVSGDVGKDVRPGRDKRIIWKALDDAGELKGDAFVFEVGTVAGPEKRVSGPDKRVSGPGKTFTNSIGMKFVYVPPGTFMMGSPSAERGRDFDEPIHRVTLTMGFYMGVTEVTQRQWKTVKGDNPSGFERCGDDCPVDEVSWDKVKKFIQALNQLEGTDKYRLPTEAEWEYACRAGSTTAFASGAISKIGCSHDPNLDAMGWYCGNSGDEIHPVASKKPNAWGLYDMHGNVAEWCEDRYGEYPSDPVTNPTGPSVGTSTAESIISKITPFPQVIRGGSCYYFAKRCRSANRDQAYASKGRTAVGFRLVREAESPP